MESGVIDWIKRKWTIKKWEAFKNNYQSWLRKFNLLTAKEFSVFKIIIENPVKLFVKFDWFQSDKHFAGHSSSEPAINFLISPCCIYYIFINFLSSYFLLWLYTIPVLQHLTHYDLLMANSIFNPKFAACISSSYTLFIWTPTRNPPP